MAGSRRRAARVVGLLAALVLVAAVSFLVFHRFPAEPPREAKARERATEFLDRYVAADGRVVRLDQGGDTVSEGQGYGMLLAVVAGDEDRFEAIWSWARDELQRADGLLAWHWQDGAVVDDMPASDADLEVAWALLLGAERFDRPEWREDALQLGDAILDSMTVRTQERLVLAAGPWATDDPAVVNPSYLIPSVFEQLGAATGDGRWQELRDGSHELLAELTDGGRRLPPDWALLSTAGLEAVDGPEGGGSGRYGLDAARVPVRLATSCAPEDRALAGSLWDLLDQLDDDGARVAYELTGEPASDSVNPLGLVAAAAAAAAAGEDVRAQSLLERADRLSDAHPSYYGQAWAALGRALLSTALLTDCPPGLVQEDTGGR